MHEQLEGFNVSVDSLGIALCKLKVVILHDDVRIALADHLGDVGQIVAVLLVDCQHVLHYFELVVLVGLYHSFYCLSASEVLE